MADDELAWLMESIGETRAVEIRTADEHNGGRPMQSQIFSVTTSDADSGMARWSALHNQTAVSKSSAGTEAANGHRVNAPIHSQSTSTKRQPAADPQSQGTVIYVKGQWVDKYTGRPVPGATSPDPVIASTPIASTSRQGVSAQPMSTTTSQSTRTTSRQQAGGSVPRPTEDSRQRRLPPIEQNTTVNHSPVRRMTSITPAATVNINHAQQQQLSSVQPTRSLYKTKQELLKLRSEDMCHDEFEKMLGQLFSPGRKKWLDEHQQWFDTLKSVGDTVRYNMMEIARLSEDHTVTKQYMCEFACIPDLDQHLKAARLATMYNGGHDLDQYFDERPQYLAFYRLAQRQFAEKILANNKNLQRVYGAKASSVVHPSSRVAAGETLQTSHDSVLGSSTRQASTARSVAASSITQSSSNNMNMNEIDLEHSTALQGTNVAAQVEKSIVQSDPMTGLTFAVGSWSISPRMMETSHDDTTPSSSNSKSESVSSDEHFSSSSPLNLGRGRAQHESNDDQNKATHIENHQNDPIMLALIEKNAKSMLGRAEMMVQGFTFKGGIFYQNH